MKSSFHHDDSTDSVPEQSGVESRKISKDYSHGKGVC